MTTNAIVLGAGKVGSIIAEDLASSGFNVAIADINRDALGKIAERSNGAIAIHAIDCSDQDAINAAIGSFDIVFGALPSWLGFNTLKTVIESGKPYCDISFMAEDPRTLDALAQEHGVTCIVDFGVAPGMSHLLCAHAVHLLDTCERLDIVVGGLPVERTKPWEYKASFCPRDVIDEYLRPARLVEHGEIVAKPALSDVECIDLPKIGTLEAFNTDGLRTLCDTLNVPWMRERTLRYPGHASHMQLLKDGGFFQTTPIMVGDVDIKPIDVTAQVLIDGWKYEPQESDLTIMRVQAEGMIGDASTCINWDLLDYYDATTDQSSMARTTGFPVAAMGRMIADGTIQKAGVHPPETFGDDEHIVRRLLLELEERKVFFQKTMEQIR